MKRTLIALATFGLFAVGCEGTDPTTPTTDLTPQAARGGVIHRASVGGADLCTALGESPGCDANFSLTAREKANGSVKGQWQDTFKIDGRGVSVHITIDCLHVSGNEAWVSGVVTGGPFSGVPTITRIADNGTSANDIPDQISFTFEDDVGGCTAAPDLPLLDLTEGQVKVY